MIALIKNVLRNSTASSGQFVKADPVAPIQDPTEIVNLFTEINQRTVEAATQERDWDAMMRRATKIKRIK